jgi:predicted kinase
MMLIILGGLPGTGKTTIARELARQLDGVHIRIDTIEQAIRDSGIAEGPMNDAGYRVGYAVAEDNLRLGRFVIADSVNPIAASRDAWRAVAKRAGKRAIEVEMVCSDAERHRERVEARVGDIPDHQVPTWQEVLDRDYQPWQGDRLVIDTALLRVEQSVKLIRLRAGA